MMTHMKRIVSGALVWVAVLSGRAAPAPAKNGDDKPGAIMCGEQKSGRLLLMDAEADWSDPDAILWQWSAAQSPDIINAHKGWFALPTECKRVLGGTHVILSASGGAVAMIRMADKKVAFYAHPAGNPHSVEILPDGNLVCASSEGFLAAFCTAPAASRSPEQAEFSKQTLAGAHGVVWDRNRQRLWALGSKELICCAYNANRAAPALEVEARFTLPGYGGGHDLFPVPGTRKLFVTGQAVWIFDTEKETFAEFDPCPSVKCVTQRDDSGPVFFMRPTKSWWSDSIISPDGKARKTLPGARFYKVRWWVPNDFSYGD